MMAVACCASGIEKKRGGGKYKEEDEQRDGDVLCDSSHGVHQPTLRGEQFARRARGGVGGRGVALLGGEGLAHAHVV